MNGKELILVIVMFIMFNSLLFFVFGFCFKFDKEFMVIVIL